MTRSALSEMPLGAQQLHTAWRIQTTPTFAGAITNALDGVSCRSVTACTAVGSYQNSASRVVTLAQAWNGVAWHIQATPNPAGSTLSAFYGVSCHSATACTAIGEEDDSSGTQFMLAKRWNGTPWRIQTTANSAGVIDSVSCNSATACTAAGSYYNSAGIQLTLAERWNGTAWRIQTTPNRASATNSMLGGVSCSTATACTAVGSSYNGVISRTLAEAEHG